MANYLYIQVYQHVRIQLLQRPLPKLSLAPPSAASVIVLSFRFALLPRSLMQLSTLSLTSLVHLFACSLPQHVFLPHLASKAFNCLAPDHPLARFTPHGLESFRPKLIVTFATIYGRPREEWLFPRLLRNFRIVLVLQLRALCEISSAELALRVAVAELISNTTRIAGPTAVNYFTSIKMFKGLPNREIRVLPSLPLSRQLFVCVRALRAGSICLNLTHVKRE
eukprot:3905149-Pleurochrysis_carterae.AAC.1